MFCCFTYFTNLIKVNEGYDRFLYDITQFCLRGIRDGCSQCHCVALKSITMDQGRPLSIHVRRIHNIIIIYTLYTCNYRVCKAHTRARVLDVLMIFFLYSHMGVLFFSYTSSYYYFSSLAMQWRRRLTMTMRISDVFTKVYMPTCHTYIVYTPVAGRLISPGNYSHC